MSSVLTMQSFPSMKYAILVVNARRCLEEGKVNAEQTCRQASYKLGGWRLWIGSIALGFHSSVVGKPQLTSICL